MRFKFQYKLLLSLIAVLTVTAVAITYVWYTFSRDMLTESLLESNERLLAERVKDINDVILTLDYQSRVLSVNNPLVKRGLDPDWQSSALHSVTSRNLNMILDNVYAGSLSIQTLEIGSMNGMHYGRGIRKGPDYIRERGIDARLERSGGDLLILPHVDDQNKIREILLVRNIIHYGSTIGYSLISIGQSVLEDAFAGIFPANAVIRVKNRFGDLLYASPAPEDPALAGIFGDPSLKIAEPQRITGISDGDWLFISHPAADGNLTIQVAVPLKELMDSMRQKFGDIAMITIAMMVTLLIIVLFVSRWIGRNVSALSRALRRFSEGNMVQTLSVHGRDEFAQAAVAFNEMTRSIRQLLEDIKTKEKEKMEMELKALQGQINLHFLFNTLNTIKNLATSSASPISNGWSAP